MTSQEVVDTDTLMGDRITRAQVSFWMNQGYIEPVNGRRGHGYPLKWDIRTMRLTRHMARLVDAGFSVEAAHRFGLMALDWFEKNPRSTVWMYENQGIVVGLRRV